MTVAYTLAEFLTQTSYADLPTQTVDHAAMLIASTLASAACGTGISSAAIMQDLVRECGGLIAAANTSDAGKDRGLGHPSTD